MITKEDLNGIIEYTRLLEIQEKMDKIWKGVSFEEVKKLKKRYKTSSRIRKQNLKCIICGFKETIDIHHINKDRKNNYKNNLIPLCPNHHTMIHRLKKTLEDLKNESSTIH